MTQYLPYVLIAAVIAWLAWELWNAPAGWQDSEGWHAGPGVDEWEDRP